MKAGVSYLNRSRRNGQTFIVNQRAIIGRPCSECINYNTFLATMMDSKVIQCLCYTLIILAVIAITNHTTRIDIRT